MIYQNILECVGHTPMVRLTRMVGENSAQVLVKYEGLNVGGSIKTRTALNMINQAENCLLYTSPSPRDPKTSRMPSSA